MYSDIPYSITMVRFWYHFIWANDFFTDPENLQYRQQLDIIFHLWYVHAAGKIIYLLNKVLSSSVMFLVVGNGVGT
jgi:hypothetical protein